MLIFIYSEITSRSEFPAQKLCFILCNCEFCLAVCACSISLSVCLFFFFFFSSFSHKQKIMTISSCFDLNHIQLFGAVKTHLDQPPKLQLPACSSVHCEPSRWHDLRGGKSVNMSDVIYVCLSHLAYPATSVKSREVCLKLWGGIRVAGI